MRSSALDVLIPGRVKQNHVTAEKTLLYDKHQMMKTHQNLKNG